MTAQLIDWKDGLVWRLVDAVFSGADPVEACRRFEEEYLRLRADELLEARQQVLEAVRYAWPLKRATGPAEVAA